MNNSFYVFFFLVFGISSTLDRNLSEEDFQKLKEDLKPWFRDEINKNMGVGIPGELERNLSEEDFQKLKEDLKPWFRDEINKNMGVEIPGDLERNLSEEDFQKLKEDLKPWFMEHIDKNMNVVFDIKTEVLAEARDEVEKTKRQLFDVKREVQELKRNPVLQPLFYNIEGLNEAMEGLKKLIRDVHYLEEQDLPKEQRYFFASHIRLYTINTHMKTLEEHVEKYVKLLKKESLYEELLKKERLYEELLQNKNLVN